MKESFKEKGDHFVYFKIFYVPLMQENGHSRI